MRRPRAEAEDGGRETLDPDLEAGRAVTGRAGEGLSGASPAREGERTGQAGRWSEPSVVTGGRQNLVELDSERRGGPRSLLAASTCLCCRGKDAGLPDRSTERGVGASLGPRSMARPAVPTGIEKPGPEFRGLEGPGGACQHPQVTALTVDNVTLGVRAKSRERRRQSPGSDRGCRTEDKAQVRHREALGYPRAWMERETG